MLTEMSLECPSGDYSTQLKVDSAAEELNRKASERGPVWCRCTQGDGDGPVTLTPRVTCPQRTRQWKCCVVPHDFENLA